MHRVALNPTRWGGPPQQRSASHMERTIRRERLGAAGSAMMLKVLAAGVAVSTFLSINTGSSFGASGGDVTPPAAPTIVSVGGVSQTGFGIGWLGSTDNVGVAGYDIFRNGVLDRTTTAVSASFSGLTCSTTYVLGVDAYDAAGNRSPLTTTSATTANCGGGGDVTPPAAPTIVSVGGVSQTGFGISWPGSTDNVGVAGYDIFMNGMLDRTTTAVSASYSGLTCSTTYLLGVDTYDAAGNRSPLTTTSATTANCGTSSGSSSGGGTTSGSTGTG